MLPESCLALKSPASAMHKICNKRTAIAVVAIIDMMFGAVLFSLYLRRLTFFYVSLDSSSPDNSTNPAPSFRLLLLLPLSLNGFQVLMAYHLLMSTRKHDTFRSLAKATMWFQSAVVILAFLCFKLFLMLVFARNEHQETWPLTITVWETLFKLFSLYIVKEFLEDLKALVYAAPTVHFYSVYVPPSSPSPQPPQVIGPEQSPTMPTNFGPSSSPVPPDASQASPPSYQNALNYPNYLNNNRLSTVSNTSNPVFV